jgi:hypothetical protein
VRHEPNIPSGGEPINIELGAFLAGTQGGPEHQALLRLIGSLIDEQSGAAADSSD